MFINWYFQSPSISFYDNLSARMNINALFGGFDTEFSSINGIPCLMVNVQWCMVNDFMVNGQWLMVLTAPRLM